MVAVNVEVGQQVNANTAAIEIADPSVVEVSGSVDEIDVLYLQTGAEAIVSLEALGSQTLRGDRLINRHLPARRSRASSPTP